MTYGRIIGGEELTDGNVVRFPRINATSDTLAADAPGQAPIGSIIQYLDEFNAGNLLVRQHNTFKMMSGTANTVLSEWTVTDWDNGDLGLSQDMTFIPDRREVAFLNGSSGNRRIYVYTLRGTLKRIINPGLNVGAMTYDEENRNLIISDTFTSTIYVMDGVSGTESSNFDSGISPIFSLGYYNGNLLIGGGTGSNKGVYVQDGISGTNDSYIASLRDNGTATGAPLVLGIAVDSLNGNLITVTDTNNAANHVHIHSGFTTTATTTYQLAENTGVRHALAFYQFNNIPDGWVKATGQTISDPDSPWNGKTLPNLSAASTAHADAEWIMRIK